MTELEQQGQGLPAFEQSYLGFFLKLGTAFYSDDLILREIQLSSQDILAIVDEHDYGVLSETMLIPRLQGMENSSRNWSVLMTLDHLAQVNSTIMDTIRQLKNGSQPFVPIQIDRFKPDDEVGAEAIERFREVSQRYWAFAKSHQPLKTQLKFQHPWFGELDGHGWHFLASAHQKIHRRQIRKILALIGVP